jgi:hypothetical protein
MDVGKVPGAMSCQTVNQGFECTLLVSTYLLTYSMVQDII